MDFQALQTLGGHLWLYLAAPLAALAFLIASVRLRAPQWRLLRHGGKAIRTPAKKGLAPGLATVLTTVGTLGAAGAVGAATAVSLGGPGVLPWLWLFGIVMAPLHYAEVWLARTDAPGQSDADATGSLTRRLRRMGDRWRIPAFVSMVLVLACGFAFGGGVQGQALAETADVLLPGSTLALVCGAAGVGAAFVIFEERTRNIAAWLGLAGIVVLVVAAVWAMASDFGEAFGTLGAAFSDAFDGAPRRDEFTGAFAGEIAFAAVLWVLPPIGATSGVVGAMHSLSGGKTRPQASAALFVPFTYAVVGTLLVMAFCGTGAYGERYADRRGLMDTKIYRLSAASASQRTEGERLYDGMVRIVEGEPRNPALSVGTARGMVSRAKFELDGEPADLALRVEDGVPFEVLQPGRMGALDRQDFAVARRIEVVGEMLPTGGGLVMRAMGRGESDLAARFGLAGLLALAAVGFGVWGWALGRVVPHTAPRSVRIAVGLLPALGAVGAVLLGGGWIALIGGAIAALTLAFVSIVLIATSRQVADLIS